MAPSKFENTADVFMGKAVRPRPRNAADITELVAVELSRGDKRSEAYRRGVAELLRSKILGSTFPHPFRPGTAEFDAYYSGVERGHAVLKTLAPEERK